MPSLLKNGISRSNSPGESRKPAEAEAFRRIDRFGGKFFHQTKIS